MRLIRGSLSDLQLLIDVRIGRADGVGGRATYRGLIDTGATRTCLTLRVIQNHDLEPRGRMLTQSARTFAERRRAYALSLGMFCATRDMLGSTSTLYVLPGEFAAPDFQDNDSFDVLIGMDFLSMGRLVLDRGEFSSDFE